ncbi:hypothetical protein [Sphingomonas sp. BK580]|uniref:hypothetical protein n=1 Tax=Sphingomonas sp. BK580 TaxID=2586972 RepID=UPI00160C34D6|nr:hypothetical protein [Sphingomonas sp. BK580]MBB3695370.1 hypothetical protein [Sphingomonas sp. BK580]
MIPSRRLAALLAALAIAGCTATAPTTAPRPQPVAAALPSVGMESVIGQDAAALVRSFGPPDADVREGTARKLQFSSAICILDAYLYPPSGGGGEAKVTWVDSRQRDGRSIDRASCVAALARRDGGK